MVPVQREGDSGPEGCRYVARYLDRFLEEGERSRVDLDQVGEHVGVCPACYSRLQHFFHTVELPESSYLRETLDELGLSLFNLGRAIIRDRPADEEDDTTQGLRITEEGGGSARENVEAGVEMIEDAEDYAGSHVVGGMDMMELRRLLQDAEKGQGLRTELALPIFRRITQLDCRYLARAWNWIGALHYKRGEFDEAEAAFLKALSCKEAVDEVRSFAHCTLAYIFKQRGDLDRAVRAAVRSVAFAQEDDKDPWFGRFAELYCRLLRGGPEDEVRARAVLAHLTSDPNAAERLRNALNAPHNAPVLATYRKSRLNDVFPVVPT